MSGGAARAGRLALLAALVLGMLAGGGRALLAASLPVMERVFTAVAPDLRLLTLEAHGAGALPGLQSVVMLARPVQVGTTRVEPHPDGFARSQLRLGQLLQAPLLAVLLLLGWPGGSPLRRLALAVVPLALLWGVDAPVVLAGMVWQLLLDAHAPGSGTLLTRAGDFLQGGGRLAIAGAIAAAAIALDAGPRRAPAQLSLRP